MIVAPFGLFQVQVEYVFWQAFRLRQPHLGHAPEPLDAVDVNAAAGEFVLGMIDAEVPVAEVDQPVITAPTVHCPAGDLHRKSAKRES